VRSSGLALLVALGFLPLAAQRPGQLFTSPPTDEALVEPARRRTAKFYEAIT
jgi:hypothetical protein